MRASPQPKGKSWIVLQKARNSSEFQHFWAYSQEDAKVYVGEKPSSIIDKITKEKGERFEVPSHYICVPTGFDLQVHLRFPGQSDKETLEGGLLSAFMGGYDSLLTMPNSQPFLDSPEILKNARERFYQEVSTFSQFSTQQYSLPTVFFSGSGTLGMKGDKVSDIGGLVEAGAAAITDDGWGIGSSQAMKQALELSAKHNVPFLQHAEMPGHGGVASASAIQKKYHWPLYPDTAESEMVARDIRLLKQVPGAHYHALHISTRKTLEEIRKGKEAGLNITAEVTPHHLFFSNEDIPPPTHPQSTFFKMNPPLFSPTDRGALREGLQSGLIDCVSTDHAPHTLQSKELSWEKAPFGTRGLITALPTLITLMKQGALSLERLIEVYALKGREILPSAPEPKGYLFVDPEEKFTLSESSLPGISSNSCFLSQELLGIIALRVEPECIFTKKKKSAS